MKDKASCKTGPEARQSFFVPAQAPFLEIRTTLDSVLPYAEHFHRDFSLGIILDGRTCFLLDGALHVAEKGDMVIISPGRTHSCNPLDGKARSYHMLFIDPAWVWTAVGGAKETSCRFRECGPVVRDFELFEETVSMIECARSSWYDASSALRQLLFKLNKFYGPFRADGENHPDVSPNNWPGWPGIADEYERFPSVTRMAESAGIRRESFSRAVHRKTGLPPVRYLHCLRLERARRMLRRGSTVAEAAVASGYADQSHFHRMFLKFFSVTPGCYRKGGSHSYKK